MANEYENPAEEYSDFVGNVPEIRRLPTGDPLRNFIGHVPFDLDEIDNLTLDGLLDAPSEEKSDEQ